MNFNPHTLPHIVCFGMALCNGAFVLSRNPRAEINRTFFLLCVTIMAWMAYDFPANFTVSDEFLTRWFRYSYCFISFVPIMVFTFVTRYMNTPRNVFWYRINSLIGLFFCLISILTDWIVAGVNHLPSLPYPKAGSLHFLLVAHCAYLVLFSAIPLLKILSDQSSPQKLKQHARFMLYGVVIMGVGMWDFMGNYGVPIYTIGAFSCTGFLIVMTTAMAKYQFMDIEIVLKRSFVYTCLVSTMTAIYLLAVIIFEHNFSNYLKFQAFAGSFITAVVTTIIFVPLRNWLQHAVDRLFFRATPVAIAEENEQLRQEVMQTEKLKAVATLASGLAHEIKNPLTAIQTFNDYLPSKKTDPDFLDQYQAIVCRETRRINTLLQELLSFAKPNPPQRQNADMRTVLEEAITLVRPQCTKRNIAITTTLMSVRPINIDADQIKQALLNLLFNAMDAMPGGGTLTVTVRDSGGFLEILMSDSGCGISAKDLSHIFDPFFTKKKTGTGLGLSITQSIIKQHGGTITVKSILNEGTEFFIRLPYAP